MNPIARVKQLWWIPLSIGLLGAPASGFSMPDPAALYCQALGYELVMIRNEEGGQSAIVRFPDGTEANSWAFVQGDCCREWTAGALLGYRMEVRRGGKYARQHLVRILSDGSEVDELETVIEPILRRMERSEDCF